MEEYNKYKVMLVALKPSDRGYNKYTVALSTSKSISDTHSILINKRYIETQSISDNDKNYQSVQVLI